MIIDPEKLKSIPNSREQTCFACGAKNPHGLKMKFLTDGQRIYSFLQVPSTMTGWDRTVHGGILSTILDETMGWAIIYLLKKVGVTQSITIDFMASVNSGDPLTVVGGLSEKKSERSAVMEGAIYNADDALCVKAKGEFAVMRPKAAVRLGLASVDYMKLLDPVLSVD